MIIIPTYMNLQDVLLKAVCGLAYDSELKAAFQGSDFDQSQLEIQLQHFTAHFKDLGDSQKRDVKCRCSFYSQVVVLVTLILVIPTTNTGSECCFLHYGELRVTLGQQCLR